MSGGPGGSTVAGPVAIAVAALAAVYLILEHNLNAVDEANKKVADSATAAQGEMEKLNSLRTSLADRAAIATGKETKAAQEYRHEVVAITAAYGDRITQAQAAVAEEDKARAAYGGVGAELDRRKAVLAGLNVEQGKLLQQAAQGAFMEPPGASKAGTKAVTERKDAYVALAAEIARISPIQKTDAQVIADMEQKASDALKAGTLSAKEYALALDGIHQAQDRLASDAMKRAAEQAAKALSTELDAAISSADDMMTTAQAQLDQITADAQAAVDKAKAAPANAVNMANGGPSAVMGAVASAGPYGALIAALVQFAGHFDELGNMFSDFTVSFNRSIAALPKTIMDNIGTWFAEGTASAVEMIPNMVESLVTALFDPESWKKVGSDIMKGFGDSFGGATSKSTGSEKVGLAIAAILTGGLSTLIAKDAQSRGQGTHDLGGFVSQPGLAMVHAGEWIQSAQGVNNGGGAGQASMARSGGDTHIHIHGSLISTVPDLVRALNREMTQSGLRWAA